MYHDSSGWDLRRDDNWRLEEFKQFDMADKPQELVIPVEWGDYRIIATSPDGQKTVYSFDVGWKEGEAQIPVKPDQLSMRLDKPSYLNGETVNVELASPFAGTVLLELVGDKQYLHTQIETTGKVTAQLEIPKNIDRHDLYLIATQVGVENSYARRLLAVAPIKLNRDNRKLNVDVDVAETLEPLKSSVITVNATGTEGMENPYVLLTIADKGIVNLSRYQVPDVFAWFYDQKRLNVDIIDLYSRQFESRPSSFIAHRYGGDADVADAPIDDLVETKTFNKVFAPVKLDKDGKAQISVEVPDYNGEVQVVATVFDGKNFGQHSTDVQVKAPIVAELSVPRFFANNSVSQVMLEASNQTDKEQQVILSLSAFGGIKLDGDTSHNLRLEPNESVALPISVNVGTSIGMSDLILSVESDVYNVTREWRVPVRSASPYVTKQHTVVLERGGVMDVTEGYWDGLLPLFQGGATVSFSRTPLIDPLTFVQGLFRYPYGCVEQTTSKAFPWLLQGDKLSDIKASAAGEKTEQELLMMAISRLESAQKSSGGFGLWSQSSKEEVWLSAYVADFLLKVQKRYPEIVSDKMLERLVDRLKHHIRQNSTEDDDKVFAGYVLVSHGLLSFSDASLKLKDLDTKQTRSNAQLGAVFYLLGDKPTAEKYFIRSRKLLRRKLPAGQGNYYDSQLSSAAKIISIVSELERIGPISDELDLLRIKAAEFALELVAKRQYFSTQEKYALAKAGLHLSELNEAGAVVGFNGNDTVADKPFELVVGDHFENTSEGTLYAITSMQGYADPSTLTSSIEFSHLKRSYFDKTGKEKLDGQFNVGDIVIAKVDFTLKRTIERGMMVDYLPSGMVLENPEHTAAADILSALDMKSKKADMIEYRDDRFVVADSFKKNVDYTYFYVMRAVTSGETQVPNLYIEDMYAPEDFVFESVGAVQNINIGR